MISLARLDKMRNGELEVVDTAVTPPKVQDHDKGVKVRWTLLLLFVGLFISSCENDSGRDASPKNYGEASVNTQELEGDFITWWTYFNDSVTLSDDFVALDSSLNKLSKQEFIASLTSGTYIPVKLNSNNDSTYLKLHALSSVADQKISPTIRNKANTVLGQLKMEGSELPRFDFSTLDGQMFNNDNTKGKTLVLKCWFVACQACIEEIPELNNLVGDNKDRDDVEFISLAYDSPESLRKFLQKRDFSYLVAPVEREFLESSLNVRIYPTHIVVDKNGIIRKVVNSVSELKTALDKLI